jgi:CubicO group peptidase (beta-lactamase class C family)
MFTRHRFANTLLTVLITHLALGQNNPPSISVGAEAIVQQLGKAFVQEKSRVGLSIGIVQNGQTRFYNFGTTEKGKTQPPTEHTIYEIGSISKTFSSLLLAQAVVEKRVSLDDDVRRYLDGTYSNLTYEGKPIRLVHLTNMTSELPDNFPERMETLRQANPDSVPFMVVHMLSSYTRQNFFDDLHAVKLQAAPGSTPRHSNVAAQLLGYVLEAIYQTSFAELVKTRIEQPLALRNTLLSELPPEQLAIGYDEKGNRMPAFTMPAMQAAGGLRYSTADLLKYIAHQLNEKDSAVNLSHRATWGSTDSEGIALNWLVSKTIDSQRRLRHSGGTFGFASYCDFYPDQRFGVVLLANDANRITQGQLDDLSKKITNALLGEPKVLTTLNAGLQTRGYERAVAVVNDVKRKHPELHLSEDYVNSWGYQLAGQGKLREALEIFRLNVSLYPKNWNTYDSLAETYERIGNRQFAIVNYKRSLALNPNNSNATEHLKKLGEPASK